MAFFCLLTSVFFVPCNSWFIALSFAFIRVHLRLKISYPPPLCLCGSNLLSTAYCLLLLPTAYS